MRIFEVMLIIVIYISIINIFFIKKYILKIMLLVFSNILCLMNFFIEGYRIQMLPAYILTFILFAEAICHRLLEAIKLKKPYTYTINFILILILLLSTIVPLIFPVKNLPKPKGKYFVGTSSFEFIDESREEMFTDKYPYRRLSVQVWYPADNIGDKKRENYVPVKFTNYVAKLVNVPNLFRHLAMVKTNSYLNAEITSKEDKFPVIIFSHGYMVFGSQNTIQMEELASNGYVVFSISHTYEAAVSIFPNEEYISYASSQIDNFNNELQNILEQTSDYKVLLEKAQVPYKSAIRWSEDISFIVDQVEKLNNGEIASIFKEKLDTANIGTFGHSFGGAASGQAAIMDKRIKTFINMDGMSFGDSVNKKIEQPFMVLTNEETKNSILASYHPEQVNALYVTIKGAEHFNFTDFSWLFPVLKYNKMLGSINAKTQEKIINDYVLAFFNKQLKGIKETIIDKEASIYPEVKLYKK